jgi:hypothetical protein
MPIHWLGLLSLTLFHSSLAAPVYKWVDEKGVTHYSEAPPRDRKAQEVGVQPAPAGKASQPPATNKWDDQEREFQRRRVEREEARRKKEAEDTKANREAKENCLVAQEQLHKLERGVPVYSINEKGEREYMDDKARAEELALAKKDIETYCKR